MQIAVTFRHMEADEGIKAYIKEKVQRLQKYITDPVEVHVVISTEKFRHIAEMTIIGNGVTLNSQGKNNDRYAAIDQMVDKVERQIRELRGKGKRKRFIPSSSKGRTRKNRSDFENKEEREIPSIAQRRHILAKSMLLEEAVAQLDISKEDIFVFINSDSGQMNVIHRIKNGTYEWVESYSE